MPLSSGRCRRCPLEERSSRRGIGAPGLSPVRVLLASVVGVGLLPHPAGAQVHTAEITAEAGVAITNNAGLAATGHEQYDLITTLRPRLTAARRSAGLKFDLSAAIGLWGSARGRSSSRVAPEVRGALSTELVERWLYLDAGVDIAQVEANALGPRVGNGSSSNQRTAGSYRLSPYLLRELSIDSSVLVRQELASTSAPDGGDSSTQLRSNRTVARYERRPTPLGIAVELSRMETQSSGSHGERLVIAGARAAGSLALRNQLVLSTLAGLERSELAGSNHTDAIYGLNLLWNPGPRTSVAAALEHRFFGPGGSFEFRHRTPFMSVRLSYAKGPNTVSSTLGQVNASSDLSPYIDAILTTRHPDPAVRSGLVQSLIDRQGLDARLLSPIATVALYPQLQTRAEAALVLLGRRDTVSLTGYAQTLRRLTPDGEAPRSSEAPSDSKQSGASAQVSHRLSPQLSVDAVLRWSRFSSLAGIGGGSSREVAQRVAFSRRLSPRTGISAGLQRDRLSTDALTQKPYKATQAFGVLSHRF